MKTQFMMIACLSLLGCATAHDSVYQTSDTGPFAKIKPVNATGMTTILQTYMDVESCKDRRTIFDRKSGDREYKSIQAGKPFIFTVIAHTPDRKYCNVTGTFTPVENGAYDLNIKFMGDICLVQLDETEIEKAEIPFRDLRTKKPFDNSGSWCAY